MRIAVEILINAPRDRVFAVMADIPAWPRRIQAIERIDMLTDGPVAVGTRFRETRQMFGRTASEEMTVAEFIAGERMVFIAESHGTRYRATHVLTGAGTGGTRLSLDFEGKPTTLLARLTTPLAWLLAGHVRRQLVADLADLKRAAEA
jgi:hypothetical protein